MSGFERESLAAEAKLKAERKEKKKKAAKTLQRVVGRFEYPQGNQAVQPVGHLGHEKTELTGAGWLAPKDEMDRASHRFGKCSNCDEIICVEKAVTDGGSTRRETSETLDKAFRIHVKLKHSEDAIQAAYLAAKRYDT